MTATSGYLVAAALPLLYIEAPGIISQLCKLIELSAQSRIRIARSREVLPYAGLVLLTCVMWSCVRSIEAPLSVVGLTASGWKSSLFAGLCVAFMWLGVTAFLLRPSTGRSRKNRLSDHSVKYWMPLLVGAGIVEEVWRAFCLVAIGQQSVIVAFVVTIVAFVWAHFTSYTHALSSMLFAITAAGLFLWKQSLWSTIPAHVVINVGSLYLMRAPRAWAQQRSHSTD